ncbi:hypothetical protein JB92DRAFT_2834678 [Gautieria morchelliformis]|nr:hypothetical protein JB92DRAFT_2834678 [Gautieria morchelliformis]
MVEILGNVTVLSNGEKSDNKTNSMTDSVSDDKDMKSTFDVLGGASECIRGTMAKYSTDFITNVAADRWNGKSAGEKIQGTGTECSLEEKKEHIIYLDIDLARSDFGLVDTDYQYLRDNVTHIIHAAWHINFNLILESYERIHIAGPRYVMARHKSPPSSIADSYRGITNMPARGGSDGEKRLRVAPEAAVGRIDDDPISKKLTAMKLVHVCAISDGQRVLPMAADGLNHRVPWRDKVGQRAPGHAADLGVTLLALDPRGHRTCAATSAASKTTSRAAVHLTTPI